MNTTELVEEIAENFGMTKTISKEIVSFITAKVMKEVSHGRTVKLTGFGTFYRLNKKARRGHNPQTGESVQIAKKKVPRFRAGRTFKDSVG